jgi:hypothetical protein
VEVFSVANYQLVTPTLLGQAALSNTFVTIYTTPANTRTYVKDLDIINHSANIVRIFVNLVPSGANANTSNALLSNNALPAWTTVQWTGSQILNAGASIQAKVSDNNTCTITVSGGEAV